MNITAQHVTPEEVMALLDGELSALEAKAVSAHVEECAECATISEQLRRTSLAISAWKIPAVPPRVEEAIAELTAKAGSGAEIRKPKLFIRASFWGRRQYAVLSLAAVSVLMIVVGIGIPNMLKTRSAHTEKTLSGPVPQRPENQIFDQFYSARSQKKDRGVGSGVAGGTIGGLLGGATGSAGLQDVLPQQSPIREGTEPGAPMIARTVSLSIMVKDFAASRAALDRILARYQGYSAQMNVNTTENAPRNLQASLRIPAPALPSATNDFRSLGRVETEWQSGEEVTRQHADLVARLKNSRDTEQRLRDILQQRTGKIADVLKVEEEIARVRGEIEEMEAEQKTLEHRVDFATVELQLAEEYKAQLNPPAPSVSTRIHNAFVAGYQNVTETMLGILLLFVEYVPALLIWLAILALPVVAIWRRIEG